MKLPLGKFLLLFGLLIIFNSIQAQQHEWFRATKSFSAYVNPTSINTDSSSSPYISGFYHTKDSINLRTDTGNQISYRSGAFDLFHLKLDSSGNYQWSNTFGSELDDFTYDSYIDSKNNIMIAGVFQDTISFNNSSLNATHISNGSFDGFVAKFNQNGQHLWSFSLGGIAMDQIREINTDSKNNIYLVGYISDSVDMNPGVSQNFVYTNVAKNFILKLDSNGNFMWVKLFDLNFGNIGIDKYDHLYFSANIYDTVIVPTQTGIETFTPKGPNDILFGRMNSIGDIQWVNQLQSSSRINTSTYETYPTDQDGNLHLFGTFSNSINLLNSPNKLYYSQGMSDGFICKFDTSGNEIWFKTFGGKGNIYTPGITIDSSNNLYLSIGELFDNVNFQSDSGTVSVKTSDDESTFLVKFNPNGNFEWAKSFIGRLRIEAISWNPSNDIYSTGPLSIVEFQDSIYFGGYSNIFIAKTKLCDPIPFYDTLYLCAGDSSYIPNVKTEHAGNYSQLVENSSGCDSIRYTHLVVYPSYPDTTVYSFCEGDSLLYQGNYYSKDTLFRYPASTVQGCDSSRIVLIQKDTTTVTEFIGQICEADTFYFNNQKHFQSGTYFDTLQAISGCDSILQLSLTVNPKSYFQQNVSICDGDFYPIGNSKYTQSGTYKDTLSNSLGCDSIVTTLLSVDTLPLSEQHITICEGGSYSIGFSTYTQAGVYTDTLSRFNDCDSVVITHLSLTQKEDSTINITLCEGESRRIHNQSYSQSGNYTQYLNFGGCQITLYINVKVLPKKSSRQTFALCVGDSLQVGNNVYSENGTYINTLQAANGCDSMVTTKISIPEFDIVLNENSLTISPEEEYKNVQYLWYNCDSKRVLYNETEERFEFKLSGNYAPIVILEDCRDTLICNHVTYYGDYELRVFPNPAKEVCTIVVPSAGKMKLLSYTGKLVHEHDFPASREYIYQIPGLATGLYFVVFEGDKGVLTEKLTIVD